METLKSFIYAIVLFTLLVIGVLSIVFLWYMLINMLLEFIKEKFKKKDHELDEDLPPTTKYFKK